MGLKERKLFSPEVIKQKSMNLVQDKMDESTKAKIGLLEADQDPFLNNDEDYMCDDEDLEAIKARVREMEIEALKLKEEGANIDQNANIATGSTLNSSNEEKVEVDGRSCFIGNVDYSASAEELEQHFSGCGGIQRVTILCNKFNGAPKGFAYIEFADKTSVETAKALNDSLFKGRQLKVTMKRTNKP